MKQYLKKKKIVYKYLLITVSNNLLRDFNIKLMIITIILIIRLFMAIILTKMQDNSRYKI